jgi:hypothetical protein
MIGDSLFSLRAECNGCPEPSVVSEDSKVNISGGFAVCGRAGEATTR